MSLATIAGLLAALDGAHTTRAIARVLGEQLALAGAVVGDAAWGDVTRRPKVILGEGVTLFGAPLEPALRAAVAQVVASALRTAALLHRVGRVSQQAHRELRKQSEPAALVARSPKMLALLERLAAVAGHATTVLITGESGTGKEVVARELHRRSPRAQRPLVLVNCGALPAALVESELFGHERGAFTGAERRHAGVFERASGGTLVLDEIGELALDAQVKLLRVIQERKVYRVGGEAPIDVDVRLVAATHRSLAHMVATGAFREDLYYRLDVFALAVPPLRERRADLPALAAQLLAELSPHPPPLTRAALAKLAAHDWPGNVRELRNVLETALILGDGGALVLPDELARVRPAAPTGTELDAAIRDAITAALRATRGKLYGANGAAARLGLPPATLQSKMKKLGIARRAFT